MSEPESKEEEKEYYKSGYRGTNEKKQNRREFKKGDRVEMDVKDEYGRTTSVTFIIHDYEYDSPNWTYSLTNASDGTPHDSGKRHAENALQLSNS
ncbi:hypothetical protein MBLNU13_g10697t1 [Cladosporium sp. NU13]